MSSRRQHPLRVGERLGDLQLVRLIGEGGMGAVYEARHATRGQAHAVKLLHPELARDPLMYARFRREAQIAASLKSKHIIPVTGFGNARDGTPYLVMDYVAGIDLGRLLRIDGRLKWPLALDLTLQACRGLQVAHEHRLRIVHRDLKPENLLICTGSDGRELLKILDFGIAKLLELHSAASVTRSGAVIGTPHYMSPEQAEGAKNIDHRTDVFALGAILYEALSGCKVYPGSTYNEVIANILLKRPVPLESLCPDLPPALVAVVARALESDPSERYQAIADFADALERIRGLPSIRSGFGIPLRTRRLTRTFDASSVATVPEQSAIGESFDAAGHASTPPRNVLGRSMIAGLALLGAGLVAHFQPWTTWKVKRTLDSKTTVARHAIAASSMSVALDTPEKKPPMEYSDAGFAPHGKRGAKSSLVLRPKTSSARGARATTEPENSPTQESPKNGRDYALPTPEPPIIDQSLTDPSPPGH